MNVAQYISQLLYRYQCVTVPGFGAFLTETVSANIQESNHTFYAPKKEISFNSYLKNNDGLLANHIAVAEKLSYDNVVTAIEKEVASWKTLLQSNESLSLKNIGEFRLNSENNLVFVPSNHLNYLTDSFGFSSFVSPAVKREELKKQVEILEEKIPIQFTPERRISAKSVLKYAAVLVMSVGGAGFGYATYVSQQEQSETILVQSEVQKEVENKIQEATFFIDNPVNPVVMNVKESNTLPFHIVAGAFRNEGNAKQILDKLTAQGFKARILAKNKHGLYPVLYGSFATYTDAQHKMTQIQNTVNQDAWLLIEDL